MRGLADAHGDILARVTSAIAPLLPLADGPAARGFPDLTRPFPFFSRARVGLHSTLPDDVVSDAQLTPVPDVSAAVLEAITNAGPRVGVLPEGPLTVGVVRG